MSKQKGASACFHKGSCVSQVSLPYSCSQSDNTELLDFFQKNVSEIIFEDFIKTEQSQVCWTYVLTA